MSGKRCYKQRLQLNPNFNLNSKDFHGPVFCRYQCQYQCQRKC